LTAAHKGEGFGFCITGRDLFLFFLLDIITNPNYSPF
jgi:hypothetical protein